jgi:2-polyprenyl-3-methyl-5-hydroxy-6-metoxy-1,4-benzoquinol methylase
MFTERSEEKELLDLGPAYYSQDEFIHCQKMLFKVNQFLGFFKNTVRLLTKFSPSSSVLDVGCGGGLFLLHLSKYFPDMQFIGTDISSEAINTAKQNLHHWQKTNAHANVNFQLQSTFPSVDVIISTLVCHHLTDEDLVNFLSQTLNAARVAVIINDLHRHRCAEFFYRLISPILFRNRLITHDGLISIRRGFTRHDWILFLKKANITHYQLKWFFPFRWRLILWKK